MYRIFPNKRTTRILEASLEECRWFYNATLDFRKKAWEDEKRTANYYEAKRRIPERQDFCCGLGYQLNGAQSLPFQKHSRCGMVGIFQYVV